MKGITYDVFGYILEYLNKNFEYGILSKVCKTIRSMVLHGRTDGKFRMSIPKSVSYNLETYLWTLSQNNYKGYSGLLNGAIRYKNALLIDYLITEERIPVNKSHLITGVMYSNFYFMSRYGLQSYVKDPIIVREAVKCGDIIMIDWLLHNHFEIDDLSYLILARNGNLCLLDWLVRKKEPKNDVSIMTHAALYGNLNIIKWGKDRGYPLSNEIFGNAASGGHLQTLTWLLEQGCPHNSSFLKEAAATGMINVIEWAYSIGYAIPGDLYLNAIGGGHVETLEYLSTIYVYNPYQIMYESCRLGILPVLKWIWNKGARPTLENCITAAVRGKREVLEWLKTQGCQNAMKVRCLVTRDGYKALICRPK